jgi:hypothetical protein
MARAEPGGRHRLRKCFVWRAPKLTQWVCSCLCPPDCIGCTSAAQVEEPGTVPGSLLPLLYVDSVADLLSIKDKVPSTWGSVGDSCTVS